MLSLQVFFYARPALCSARQLSELCVNCLRILDSVAVLDGNIHGHKKLHFKLCKMRTGERRGESTASMSFRSQWLVNIARDKMGLAFTVFMLYQNIYFCMCVMHKQYFDSASVISDKRLPLANKIRAEFAVAFYQRPAIAEILLRKNLHCW